MLLSLAHLSLTCMAFPSVDTSIILSVCLSIILPIVWNYEIIINIWTNTVSANALLLVSVHRTGRLSQECLQTLAHSFICLPMWGHGLVFLWISIHWSDFLANLLRRKATWPDISVICHWAAMCQSYKLGKSIVCMPWFIGIFLYFVTRNSALNACHVTLSL